MFPNLGDAMNVFQLASFFGIKDLMLRCDAFLDQYQVDPNSVFARYDCALAFKNRPLVDACRKLVSEDTEAVFRSKYFCMASRVVIEDILKLNKFTVSSEVEVIEAILKWCKADCKRRHGSTEYLYVRDSFLPFCRNLRFLTLDIQEFFDFIENHELLLTKHEQEQFTAKLINPTDHKISIPAEFSISRSIRRFKLTEGSSSTGSVKGIDISRSNSTDLYSHTNGNSHLSRSGPNRSLSHFSESNGANNYNQILNDTAKKSNQILSYVAQSNSRGNLVKPNQNYKQALSQSSQQSGLNGVMKPVPNSNSSLSVSPPANGVNNCMQLPGKDYQALTNMINSYNFPHNPNGPKQVNGHSNGPRQVNGHLNSNGKVLSPAISTYSSYVPEKAPVNDRPLYEVLPNNRKHTPILRVVPQPAAKEVIMSYEFHLHEMQKQISSSCDSDIKCHVDINMLKGTIFINGIELKVKDSKTSDEDDIEVYLCITGDKIPISYSENVKPNNDVIRLPFEDPVMVAQNNPVNIEVMIDDLKVNRCGVCRAQEMMCELNNGLDVMAEIKLRSNLSSGNESFVFLISKILYSVPKY